MILDRDETLRALANPNMPRVKADVAPLPVPSGGAVPTGMVGLANPYGIPTTSLHPEEAGLLLSFMAGPEGARILASHGKLPLYQSEQVREAWGARNPAPPPGTETLFTTQWRLNRIQGETEVALHRALSRLVNEALAGRISVDTAIDQFLQERQMVGG